VDSTIDTSEGDGGAHSHGGEKAREGTSSGGGGLSREGARTRAAQQGDRDAASANDDEADEADYLEELLGDVDQGPVSDASDAEDLMEGMEK
jgi:hypothetical protein